LPPRRDRIGRAAEVVGTRWRTRFAQVPLGGEHPWKGGGARPAVRRFGAVRKSPSKATAVKRPVSGFGGDAGNRPSGAATRTTGRTRPGHSARGRKAIAATGASTGAHTRDTARAIARRRESGSAIGDARSGLQRWTRQRRFRACLQALTGSCRRPPKSLQRWTRGSWK
jgi:hypothetical protein